MKGKCSIINPQVSKMADSPYIPQDIKDYVRKHSLETQVNSLVNDVIRSKPEDPFGFMIGILQKSASSSVEILRLKAFEHLSGQGFGSLKILAKVSYMNNPVQFFIGEPHGILDDQAIQFDADRMNGKGISKSISFFNEVLAPKVLQYKCSEQNQIDKILESALQESGKTNLYSVNTLSYALSRVAAHATSQPLYKTIAQLSESSKFNVEYIINCLEGGKAIGSKCKVFKYMIISNKQKHDPFLSQTVLASIRKSIVSGKGGEAALKFSGDRTFVCPLDTILDNLKIVEQAINGANAKQFFTIGLSWAADTLYSPDTKKYELQNPKTPFDNDQMIDYLVKLATDKPIISYFEDPLATSQKASWRKLKTKLSQNEGTKHVKLGTRSDKLLNIHGATQDLKNTLNDLSINATADSHPDLSPEQLQQKSSEKFCLDLVHTRAFELKTLSKVLAVQKILSKANTRLILQDNLHETYDTTLVDVCVGSNAVLNLSTINQGKYDRVSKLTRVNELFWALQQ